MEAPSVLISANICLYLNIRHSQSASDLDEVIPAAGNHETFQRCVSLLGHDESWGLVWVYHGLLADLAAI